MESLPENQLPFEIYLSATEKVKQREALENAYTNFVEPQVNQQIEVPVHPLPPPPVNSSVCCSVCGWLLLTLLYFLCIGYRNKR